MSNKYNGWTNYATWRVNLEIFDGSAYFEGELPDVYEYSKQIEAEAQEYIESNSQGIARDYALAFLNEVNWYEIAQHLLDDFKAEQSQEA